MDANGSTNTESRHASSLSFPAAFGQIGFAGAAPGFAIPFDVALGYPGARGATSPNPVEQAGSPALGYFDLSPGAFACSNAIGEHSSTPWYPHHLLLQGDQSGPPCALLQYENVGRASPSPAGAECPSETCGSSAGQLSPSPSTTYRSNPDGGSLLVRPMPRQSSTSNAIIGRRRQSNSSATAGCADDGQWGVPAVKRMRHLESNRIAAKKCRQKTRSSQRDLELRQQELEKQYCALNAQVTLLKDEVISLKTEILSHASCDDEMIRGYIFHAATEVVEKVKAGNYGGTSPW